jgi:hypothetical protein
MNREINKLKNEIVKKKIFTLIYGEVKTIHYNNCKKNCHHPFDC